MDRITAIRIDNVVVSTNLQGIIRVTPISLLEKRGFDFSYLPRMSYGSRQIDNAVISSLVCCEISFDEAFNRGTLY